MFGGMHLVSSGILCVGVAVLLAGCDAADEPKRGPVDGDRRLDAASDGEVRADGAFSVCAECGDCSCDGTTVVGPQVCAARAEDIPADLCDCLKVCAATSDVGTAPAVDASDADDRAIRPADAPDSRTRDSGVGPDVLAPDAFPCVQCGPCFCEDGELENPQLDCDGPAGRRNVCTCDDVCAGPPVQDAQGAEAPGDQDAGQALVCVSCDECPCVDGRRVTPAGVCAPESQIPADLCDCNRACDEE